MSTLAYPVAPTPVVGDSPRVRLAERIAARLAGRSTADASTRRAVATLTAAADPARRELLEPTATDGSPLVERLAVWALRRADDATISTAASMLDGDVHTVPVVIAR